MGNLGQRIILNSEGIIRTPINKMIKVLRWFMDKIFTKTIKIPVLSWLWRKLTKSEISIANIMSLFAAVPTVILAKLIPKIILVPEDRVDLYTSWDADTIRDYFAASPRERQLNPALAVVKIIDRFVLYSL